MDEATAKANTTPAVVREWNISLNVQAPGPKPDPDAVVAAAQAGLEAANLPGTVSLA